MAKHTNEDIAALVDLNVKIGEQETAGDADAHRFFDDLLAPAFAIKRIGAVQDRRDYINDLKKESTANHTGQ